MTIPFFHPAANPQRARPAFRLRRKTDAHFYFSAGLLVLNSPAANTARAGAHNEKEQLALFQICSAKTGCGTECVSNKNIICPAPGCVKKFRPARRKCKSSPEITKYSIERQRYPDKLLL
jgi:hypothetical protein